MLKKTYAICGMIEQSVVIPFNGANIRVDFTGGVISTTGYVPARFTTSSRLIQKAVESCEKYKKRIITLEKTEGDEVYGHNDEEKKLPGAIATYDYPDVTNTQSAKAILMDNYDIPISELGNKEAIKEKAQSLNVTFSNWK